MATKEQALEMQEKLRKVKEQKLELKGRLAQYKQTYQAAKLATPNVIASEREPEEVTPSR